MTRPARRARRTRRSSSSSRATRASRCRIVSPAKATLSGVLGLPSGAFSVSAALTDPISIGAGISIDSTQDRDLEGDDRRRREPRLSRRWPARAASTSTLKGSATLPLFGKLPTIEASYSTAGWSVAAPLGSYSLPGSSGDGSKLSDTIVGWSSYQVDAERRRPGHEAQVDDRAAGEHLRALGLVRDAVVAEEHVEAARRRQRTGDRPDQHVHRRLLAPDGVRPLGQHVHLRRTRARASSIKLTKTYFEIEKKASDFNLALGGEAALSTAASGSTPASSVNLGIALSFSVCDPDRRRQLHALERCRLEGRLRREGSDAEGPGGRLPAEPDDAAAGHRLRRAARSCRRRFASPLGHAGEHADHARREHLADEPVPRDRGHEPVRRPARTSSTSAPAR